MNEFEDDLALAETVDSLQRQLAFQEQMGGLSRSGTWVL